MPGEFTGPWFISDGFDGPCSDDLVVALVRLNLKCKYTAFR